MQKFILSILIVASISLSAGELVPVSAFQISSTSSANTGIFSSCTSLPSTHYDDEESFDDGNEYPAYSVDSCGLVRLRREFIDASKAIFSLKKMKTNPSSAYEVLWCEATPNNEQPSAFGMEKHGNTLNPLVIRVLCDVKRELDIRQFLGESPEQALQAVLEEALNNGEASPWFVGGYFYIKGEKGKPTYIARISPAAEGELPTRIEQIPVTSKNTVIKMPRGNKILVTVSGEQQRSLPSACPMKNESLDAYTTRMCAMIEQGATFASQKFSSEAQVMPWNIKRYALAMDIENELYNLADKNILCSFAMNHNDLEMLLFAAQHDIICDTQPSMQDPLISFLMHSNNPRSVDLLKLYLPETGVLEILDTLPYVVDTKDFGAWAKELSPELVIQKAEIAYPAPREFSRCLSELIKGTSEGELAFKEYIKEHERPGFVPGVHLNPFCRKKPESCTIL